MSLDERSLIKPVLQMAGRTAEGADLGGWYSYDPGNDGIDGAYAPSATYGQWVSALARMYAIRRDPAIRDRVLRLNRLLADAASTQYFRTNHFPTYCHDKLLCGLIDSHRLANDPDAFKIMNSLTDAALPAMPGKSADTSDEPFTAPENMFLAYEAGAGDRYRKLGIDYLPDYYFDPLSEGHEALAGRHAYSHVNSLCSAAQAWFTLGDEKYLRAARNGFAQLQAQSYATGGWGPDETLRAPSSGEVAASLNATHRSFETPCGSYAHFKLTRHLLRATGDPLYGDSMEQVMYNTILGAKPILPDGSTFYYSDYNFAGRKAYSPHRWPCCSGTLPQVACDYRISCYFQDARGVYVNLYVPSTVQWSYSGSRISLTQSGYYPIGETVNFDLKLAKPLSFAIRLRIPAWAGSAEVEINGKRAKDALEAGTFASLHREWRNGDRISLHLPMRMRLVPVDDRNPDTVALVRGPLVLFAVTDTPPKVTRQHLLSAEYHGDRRWQANTSNGVLKFLPFTSIKDEQYSTYVKVMG